MILLQKISERLLWSSVCTPHGTERADAVGGDWLIARLLVAARIRIRLRAKVRLGRLIDGSVDAEVD